MQPARWRRDRSARLSGYAGAQELTSILHCSSISSRHFQKKIYIIEGCGKRPAWPLWTPNERPGWWRRRRRHGSSPGAFGARRAHARVRVIGSICSSGGGCRAAAAAYSPFTPANVLLAGAARWCCCVCVCCWCCQASGRGARTLSRYVLAGLVPLCLFAALVLDRAGESVPAALLSSNPALQAAADLERAGAPLPRPAPATRAARPGEWPRFTAAALAAAAARP